METRRGYSVLCFVALFGFWASANALLSPKGVNFEGNASFDGYKRFIRRSTCVL
ncbi:hypothetical protein CsSME_00037120 [Camellia sinensis var. sinensis]